MNLKSLAKRIIGVPENNNNPFFIIFSLLISIALFEGATIIWQLKSINAAANKCNLDALGYVCEQGYGCHPKNQTCKAGLGCYGILGPFSNFTNLTIVGTTTTSEKNAEAAT